MNSETDYLRITSPCAALLLLGVLGNVAAAAPDWQSTTGTLPDGPAASVRDQFQTTQSGGGYFWASRYLAQTFTAGMSGQLAHVNVWVDTWTGQPSLPATLSLVQTVNGAPTGAVLGSVSVPQLTLGWYQFDLQSQAINLTAGTQYGFILSNNDPTADEPSDGVAIQWYNNVYPAGGLWEWTPAGGWQPDNPFGTLGEADMAFETWIVPEPAAVSLLVLGAGLFGLRAARAPRRCNASTL